MGPVLADPSKLAVTLGSAGTGLFFFHIFGKACPSLAILLLMFPEKTGGFPETQASFTGASLSIARYGQQLNGNTV